MFDKIKNNIDKSLKSYAAGLDRSHGIDRISPLIGSAIREFITRPGKRVRPMLFCAGYLGYAKKQAPGLYTSSLAIELLHDFMLIHDDIIDKSETRRGKPSMHSMLNRYLKGKNCKFNGQDLSIVVGDILYAMAIRAFLAIQEEPRRKEQALKRFIEAAFFTGSGEFIELIYGTTAMDKVTKEDIYKVYDYKTACYTFACPLSMGAILGGAGARDVRALYDYGIYLGRAFQIKDDLIGVFSDEKEIGKSNLTDIREAKKTLLIWAAWKGAPSKGRKKIQQILGREQADNRDLDAIRAIIISSGAPEYCRKETATFTKKAELLLDRCSIKPAVKKELKEYSRRILSI